MNDDNIYNHTVREEIIELKLSSKILTWQIIYARREASSLQN